MGSLGLYARALAFVAVARMLLRRGTTTEALRRLSAGRQRREQIDPQRALAAIRRAARVSGGACLPQAVALTAILKRAGHDPTLVLGCRRNATRQWTAHAWVQIEELVLEPVVTVEHQSLAQLRAREGWVPSPVEQKE